MRSLRALFCCSSIVNKGDSKGRIKGRIVDLKTTILYWSIQNFMVGFFSFFIAVCFISLLHERDGNDK